MAVEVLKQQLADLTRDYTGACEAIRQLEANVAEARARATAAEAAREAVAGEVREACVRSLNGMQRLYLGSNHVFVAKVLSDAKNAIHSVPLPTPSAALQRVREQEAERVLRWAAIPQNFPDFDVPLDDGAFIKLQEPVGAYVARGLAALFPTPDAGGPA